MPIVDPKHPLFQLLSRDSRYTLEAYLFVLEALSFAQESLGMGEEPALEELEPMRSAEAEPAARPRQRAGKRRRQAERHVSGQQLCEAARRYGLQQYIGQMRKTRADKRQDFHDVYEFGEAFSRDLSFVVPDSV